MKKIVVAIIASVLIIALIGSYKFLVPKNVSTKYEKNTNNEQREISERNKLMIGKKINLKSGSVWIDDECYELATGKCPQENDGEEIVDCYTDKSKQLVVELSNKNQVVLKNKGREDTSSAKKYVVKFYNDNKELILKKEVAEGESVTPPDPPKKEGYHFVQWDKSCEKVAGDLEIMAEYEMDSDMVEIYVEDTKIDFEDKKAIVNIKVRNNPGILGMTLKLKYDDKQLCLKDAQVGNVFQKYMTLTTAKELRSGCKFVFDGVTLPQNGIKDGTILKLSFRINDIDKFKKSMIEISVKEGDVINGKLLPIYPIISNGHINP